MKKIFRLMLIMLIFICGCKEPIEQIPEEEGKENVHIHEYETEWNIMKKVIIIKRIVGMT